MARDVYNRYLKSCEKRNVDPISGVLEACIDGSSTLKLAGNCISVDSCQALARTLQHGHPFTELDFSDCLIGNEGLGKLIEFLRDDNQISTVILKGNSIKSNGTIAIADLLKRNVSIQKLSLEWNSIGTHDSDIKVLCEGLSLNTSLCVLDLRSNHIDHSGATHLANMLLINHTIQELDLRWNNLGVLGGRKLLSTLRSNGSLRRLRLEGNNVPSDITEAIGTTLSLRLSHHVLEAQHHVETLQLSAQLNQLHSDSKHKVLEVLDTLDSERTAFMQTTQLSQCEIADLKSHLEERDIAIARLESKLLEVQSALREKLAQSEELCGELEQTRSQASAKESSLQCKIEGLEKDVELQTEKSLKDMAEANAKDRTADTKIHSLELEVQILEEKLAVAGRDWDTMKESLKSRITILEAQLREKDSKSKDEIARLRQVHQKEMLSCVEECRVKETASDRRAQESEEHLKRLEKELRALKTLSGEDKGKLMEEAERLQQNLKLQTMKTGHMEDQMNELRSSQRSIVENLRTTISQQQAEKERLEQECTKLQQKLKSSHQELESEKSEFDIVKSSHKKTLKENDDERDTLRREIKRLKASLDEERKHITEMESKKESEMSALLSERNLLKQRTEQQKMMIQRFQQDEQQRMSQLKAALNSYFTAAPKLADSDIM